MQDMLRQYAKTQRSAHTFVAACGVSAIILIGLYCFYLTQAYYFSFDKSYIALRAGSPHFAFVPGFGRVVIQTGFKRQELADEKARADIEQGKVMGFWFVHAQQGYELWGSQLADRLGPVSRARWLRLLGQNEFDADALAKSTTGPSDVTGKPASASESKQPVTAQIESFTPEMVQSQISQLTSKDINSRSKAASILANLAQTRPELFTPENIQSLMGLLTGKNYIMHADAIVLILGRLIQAKPEVSQSLVNLLSNPNETIRSRATFIVEQLARKAPGSISPLIFQPLTTLLMDQNGPVRSSSLSALGQLAATRPELLAPETVHSLIALLADKDYHVRSGSTYTLGQLGQSRPELFRTPGIVQSLAALLGDQEPFVRAQAAISLGQFAQSKPVFFTPQIISSLFTGLTDSGPFVPCSSAFALSQLGRTRPELFSSESIQSLSLRLTDEDLGVRSHVTSLLGELAQNKPANFTPVIVDSLYRLLTHENPSDRSSAALILGKLAQEKPGMLQNLFMLLTSGDNSSKRDGASDALFVTAFRNVPQKERIRAELNKLKKSPRPYIRAAASQTLEMIAIGDFFDKALTHPGRIDELTAKLKILEGLDSSLHEEPLQFAAQRVLDELGKIQPENR